MVLCKFYADGYCKFGDRCRFEHYTSSRNNNRYVSSDHQQPRSSSNTFSFARTLEQISNKPQQSSFFGNAASRQSFGGQGVSSTNNSNGFSFNKMFQQVSANSATGGSQQKLPIENNARHSSLINPSGGKFAFGNTAAQFSSTSATNGNFGTFQSIVSGTTSQFGNKPNFGEQGASFFTASSKSASSNQTSYFQAKPTPPSIRNGSSTLSSSIYTQFSQISDQDRSNFEAQAFTSPIPLIPPPRELCF